MTNNKWDKEIEEFDRLFIDENLWKSNDESEAYVPVENMRNFFVSKLDQAYKIGVLDTEIKYGFKEI